MRIALLVLALYAACCVLISLCCARIFRRRSPSEGRPPVFPIPRNRWLFLLLSLTWGLPTTLLGAIVALFLRCAGHRPVRYGWERVFCLPGIDWGLELGLFFIAPESARDGLCDHEFGHALQNCVLGPFTPGVVTVPSAVRFWSRKLRARRGKPLKTAYEQIWFERTATRAGEKAMNRIGRPDRTQIRPVPHQKRR